MKSFQDWRFHSDFLICESLLVEDQEFSMARGELTIIKNAISRLMGKLKGEGELEAWVQSKITKAADYITTVADYMESGEVEESYILEQSCNKTGKDKNCPVHGMKDCSIKEEKDPKGPVKAYKSPKEIAQKHGVTVDAILRQLEKGIKVEGEHTTDEHDARVTALQHLDELPDYYSRLKKIEKVKEDWSEKYKKSIDCNNPKGFSQRAHCQGRKKKEVSEACWKGYIQKGLKKKGKRMVPNCVPVNEANKSGDSSLRDWFTKSRASDGTPGWVQLGGKYAGKPCAKQPGQTTKPKCGSSKMKADLSDKEEERAFRRKNQEDPNPNRKGKAKNVATEAIDAAKYGKTPEQLLQDIVNKDKKKYGGGQVEKSKLKDAQIGEEKDACYKKVKSRYSVWPSAYASGALVKCRKVGAANWGNKSKKDVKEAYLRIQERGSTYSIMLNWRGRVINTQMFFAKFTRPTKNEVTFEVRKVYPGAIVLYFSPSQNDPTKPLLFAGEANGSKQNTTR